MTVKEAINLDKIRYKMKLAYDGTNFSGFQVQPNKRTVQGEIEKALSKMSKEEFIRIKGAGRTDAGVHARGQIIHFDYPRYIPEDGMLRALNALGPEDIVFLESDIVDHTFHSQYLAKGKMYHYRVDNHSLKDPFTRFYAHHHPFDIDLKRTQKALAFLEGTHDFTSFASAHSDKEDKTRTIYEASVAIDEKTEEWIFTFRGNGFLYNMIRIIMGTILQVADGRRPVEDIKKILEAKDRTTAGPTVEAKGLCMMEVYYDEDAFK